MQKTTIIKNLQNFNNTHKDDGFVIVSLFGSYARGTQDIFSDIDLTYKIDHDIFFKDDAFAKLEEIEKIKKELEKKFHKKVDLIPANTKNSSVQEVLIKEQVVI
ncbi:MAG: nucleotidyltransferase domain-containing protein [Campylobacterota bacterium]|nr:nucleotidyltransferase domain-containing protein [Campylobacterota bacterium]